MRAIELGVWLTLGLIGLGLALFVLNAAYVNWLYQRPEPHSLRARLARAHLRRAVIKTTLQFIIIAVGVVAIATPSPIRVQVQFAQIATGWLVILIALLLDLDLWLDFQLLRLLSPLSGRSPR